MATKGKTMRKESTQIARAFLAKQKARAARTTTDGEALYLHGNKIAWHNPDGTISATLAGWATVTTRDRLNTLTRLMGKGSMFSQMRHAQYFGAEEIGPRDIVTL
jgi:hypothetical protein